MYTFLIVLLVFNSLVLIAAVLLQSGKGSGLSANFGGASSSSDSFVGTRQAATLLTRITWWGGGIFLVLAYVLQIMGTHARIPTSVLDPLSGQTQSAPAAPTSASPSAVPLTPINPAPPAAPAAPPTKTPPK